MKAGGCFVYGAGAILFILASMIFLTWTPTDTTILTVAGSMLAASWSGSLQTLLGAGAIAGFLFLLIKQGMIKK